MLKSSFTGTRPAFLCAYNCNDIIPITVTLLAGGK